jgi:hypothetical protein
MRHATITVFDAPSTGQDNLQLPLGRTEELRQRVIAIQGFAVTGGDRHGGGLGEVDCGRATSNDQSVSVVSIPLLASREPPKNALRPNEQFAFAAWQEI